MQPQEYQPQQCSVATAEVEEEEECVSKKQNKNKGKEKTWPFLAVYRFWQGGKKRNQKPKQTPYLIFTLKEGKQIQT